MADHNVRTAVAELVEEAKWGILAVTLLLPLIGFPNLVNDAYNSILKGSGDTPVLVRRRDGSSHPVPAVREILVKARSQPGLGWGDQVVPLSYRFAFVRVRDALTASDLLDATPLMQFVRHLGNAAAHNNRWHFRQGEPKHPAYFKDYVLDASLHGMPALVLGVHPGDLLDLLDDLSAALRSNAL